MASSQNSGLNFPHSSPPPPPPPPLSSPDSDGDSTVIVVVFVSIGSFFFLAFVLVALCCFIKKRKKKTVQETENVHVDEHLKIKEATVPGPHGAQAVLLTIEDDVHIEEEIKKNEKMGQELQSKSAGNIAGAIEAAESSSSSGHHHLEHKN